MFMCLISTYRSYHRKQSLAIIRAAEFLQDMDKTAKNVSLHMSTI